MHWESFCSQNPKRGISMPCDTELKQERKSDLNLLGHICQILLFLHYVLEYLHFKWKVQHLSVSPRGFITVTRHKALQPP